MKADNKSSCFCLIKEMTVSELTENLELSRPAVSHHMKLLLDAGLVSVKKNGKERIYSLNLQKTIKQLKDLLSSIEMDNQNNV